MRKYIVVVLAVGILALNLIGCTKEDTGKNGKNEAKGGEVSAGKEQVPGESPGEGVVLVTVDGKAITDRDLEKELNRMTQHLTERLNERQIDKIKSSLSKEALEQLINRRVLLDAAEKEGVEASRERVIFRINDLKSSFDSDEAFFARLDVLNITRDELKEEIEISIRIEMLIDKHMPEIEEPSEAEMRDFYEKNIDKYRQTELVKASHILLKVDANDSEEVKSGKRERMEKLLEEIKKGADFGELALKYSECPSSEQKGDLGYFERGQMVPEFEKVAFALGKGEVSGIVETQFGYHIIKVIDHVEGYAFSFEDAKDKVATDLEVSKREEKISEFINNLRSSAEIKYANEASVKE